jgi:HD-GYP domain-containing protein (c-di-GMP phosphodiesterase class II)
MSTLGGSKGRTSLHSLWLLAVPAVYLLAQYNYLLFHSTVELFSIVVAVGLFLIAWNNRRYLENGYLALLGVAYLFVAGIDLVHTLAYSGMGVFPDYDADLPTQLWIAARYLEASSLVVAPFLLRRKLRYGVAFGTYAAVFAGILLTIFVWRVFPSCFVEGSGLTVFKKVSEYIISAMLVGAVVQLFHHRAKFDNRVLRWLVASLVLTIASELLFTLFVSLYGISNLFGHLFKLASFYLIYRAIIETGLRQPFALVFRQLSQSQSALREANESLEMRVRERTEDLRQTNTQLLKEVSEREAAEKQLRRLNFVLRAIRNVNQLIVQERDRTELVEKACGALVEGQGYSTAWIALTDAHGNPTLTASQSETARVIPASDLLSGGRLPPCGAHVWQAGGISAIEPSGKLCADCASRSESCDTTRMTACLEHEGIRYGLLGVTSPGAVVTQEEEIDLLEEVRGDIAFALRGMNLELERHQAVEALRKSLEGTIQAIGALAESRDAYTAGHQRKVTKLAVRIGEEMGLDENQRDSLYVTGMLHDIGKMSVPAEILSKPSKLSSVEMQLIRCHSQAAYDILKGIEFPWPVAEFVLQHHERMDGSGYPNGLSGDQIHLEARIIAVADVVEAISSHRPYRPALGIDVALDEIQKNAGTQYDQIVVDACVSVFRDKGFSFDT